MPAGHALTMLLGTFAALVAALCAGLWGLRHRGHELQYSAMVAGLWALAVALAAEWLHGV
jgi:hypothetical protein